jgi:hypothetical protein
MDDNLIKLLPEVFSSSGGFFLGFILSVFVQGVVDWIKTYSEKESLKKNFKKEIELNLAQIESYLNNLSTLKQFISENKRGQLPITLNPRAFTTFGHKLLDKGYLYELYEVKDIQLFHLALSICNGQVYISQNNTISLWFGGLNNGEISGIEDPVENPKFIECLRQESLRIVDQEINSYANNIKTILLQVSERI